MKKDLQSDNMAVYDILYAILFKYNDDTDKGWFPAVQCLNGQVMFHSTFVSLSVPTLLLNIHLFGQTHSHSQSGP